MDAHAKEVKHAGLKYAEAIKANPGKGKRQVKLRHNAYLSYRQVLDGKTGKAVYKG